MLNVKETGNFLTEEYKHFMLKYSNRKAWNRLNLLKKKKLLKKLKKGRKVKKSRKQRK